MMENREINLLLEAKGGRCLNRERWGSRGDVALAPVCMLSMSHLGGRCVLPVKLDSMLRLELRPSL